jgi:hypothetical protein
LEDLVYLRRLTVASAIVGLTAAVSFTKISGFPQLADEQGNVRRHVEIPAQATHVLLDAAGIVEHRGYFSDDDLTTRVDEMAG